jgi:hypothetical protein
MFFQTNCLSFQMPQVFVLLFNAFKEHFEFYCLYESFVLFAIES